jgi:predicted nucleic acid-binding protein
MLPFDSGCARAYGVVYASVMRAGRKPRGARAVDLMIAATALAHSIPLYTRNARDLYGLENLIEIFNVDT